MGGLGRHNIEVAVHPGWELTDELVLAITISPADSMCFEGWSHSQRGTEAHSTRLSWISVMRSIFGPTATSDADAVKP